MQEKTFEFMVCEEQYRVDLSLSCFMWKLNTSEAEGKNLTSDREFDYLEELLREIL